MKELIYFMNNTCVKISYPFFGTVVEASNNHHLIILRKMKLLIVASYI